MKLNIPLIAEPPSKKQDVMEGYEEYQEGGMPAEMYWDRAAMEAFERLEFWGDQEEYPIAPIKKKSYAVKARKR